VLVAGKVWGRTSPIFANASFELHRLDIYRGHRCSRHRHLTKHNGFFVESGCIQVTVWQPTDTVDHTVLSAGESLIVPPGVDHMFVGIDEQSVVFESYWTELRGDDIVRVNTGE